MLMAAMAKDDWSYFMDIYEHSTLITSLTSTYLGNLWLVINHMDGAAPFFSLLPLVSSDANWQGFLSFVAVYLQQPPINTVWSASPPKLLLHASVFQASPLQLFQATTPITLNHCLDWVVLMGFVVPQIWQLLTATDGCHS